MNTKSFSYLALGDSYTIGEAVDQNESFPILLSERVKQDQIALKPTIIAKTGFTTDELLVSIEQSMIQETFDVVSLLIGVNNQYRGRCIDEFEIEFIELINKALSFVNQDVKRMFVLSIPDYGFTPFGYEKQTEITHQINIFNEICKKVADSKGIKYFYITDISRRGLKEPNLIAADGLHPSSKMYQEWVDLVKNDFIKIIKNID